MGADGTAARARVKRGEHALLHITGRATSSPFETRLRALISARRLHTDGSLRVELEPAYPESDAARLREIGYTVARAPSAVVSAVWRDGAGYRGLSR